jgi:hypothetical protein
VERIGGPCFTRTSPAFELLNLLSTIAGANAMASAADANNTSRNATRTSDTSSKNGARLWISGSVGENHHAENPSPIE